MNNQSSFDNKSKSKVPHNMIITCIVVLATVTWSWMIYGFYNDEKMDYQLSLNTEYNRYAALNNRYQLLHQKYNQLVSQYDNNQKFIQQSLDELYDAMDQFQVSLGNRTLSINANVHTEDPFIGSACISFKEDSMINIQDNYTMMPLPSIDLYSDRSTMIN